MYGSIRAFPMIRHFADANVLGQDFLPVGARASFPLLSGIDRKFVIGRSP